MNVFILFYGVRSLAAPFCLIFPLIFCFSRLSCRVVNPYVVSNSVLGPHKGGIYHPLFLKGDTSKCLYMTRQQAAKNKRNQPDNDNGSNNSSVAGGRQGGTTGAATAAAAALANNGTHSTGVNHSSLGNNPILTHENFQDGGGSFRPPAQAGHPSPVTATAPASCQNSNSSTKNNAATAAAAAAAAAAGAALRGAVPVNILGGASPAAIQRLMQNAAAMAAAASAAGVGGPLGVRRETTFSSSSNLPSSASSSNPAPPDGAGTAGGNISNGGGMASAAETLGAAAAAAGGIGHMSFPAKLHHMLLARPELHKECIQWTMDGRCVRIINPIRLQQTVLPSYFGPAYSYNSFANEMMNYGFSKVTRDGNHECFYHDVSSKRVVASSVRWFLSLFLVTLTLPRHWGS